MRLPLKSFPLSVGLGMALLSAAGGVCAQTVTMSADGMAFNQPLQLDSTRLLSMKAGDTVALTFPVIGRKTVVFEGLVKGAGGVVYWQGSLANSPLDRVVLKQQAGGFVGLIRYGRTQYAFRQQGPGTALTASTAMPLPQGQAYVLGQPGAEKGYRELTGTFSAVARTPVGGEIALPLPNGETEVAIVTQSGLDQDGFYQVQAVSRLNGRAYPTVLTVGTEAVFGTIVTPQGEYQIVTRAGRTQLFDPKAAGLIEPRGADHEPSPLASLAVASQALSQKAGVQAAAAATATSTDASTLAPLSPGVVDTTITLLMTYSPTFVKLWGTETAARTRLSNLVQVANSAYGNSGTGVAYKVVGWQLLSQADTTPQANLTAMYGAKGVFKNIAAQKKATGAAIAVFYAPFNATTAKTSTCGVAYVPASGSAGLGAYASQVPLLGLTALNDGQMSNGYYCSPLSFPHELGHTLGAVHDKANSSSTGVFAYSFGKGVSGQFGTVMSYISPRVALFSSPQLTCTTSGAACGTASENVVATVLQTKSLMAAQGNANAAAVANATSVTVAGWLLNTNGTPFTSTSTVKSLTAGVACTTGTTGLYVCTLPSTVSSASVQPVISGKVTTPTVGTFSTGNLSNSPVLGTTFYVSTAPKTK